MAEVTSGQQTFLSTLQTLATTAMGIYAVEQGGNLPVGFTNPVSVTGPTPIAPIDAGQKTLITLGVVIGAIALVLFTIKGR